MYQYPTFGSRSELVPLPPDLARKSLGNRFQGPYQQAPMNRPPISTMPGAKYRFDFPGPNKGYESLGYRSERLNTTPMQQPGQMLPPWMMPGGGGPGMGYPGMGMPGGGRRTLALRSANPWGKFPIPAWGMAGLYGNQQQQRQIMTAPRGMPPWLAQQQPPQQPWYPNVTY